MRKRLFEILEVGKEDDYLSRAYDFAMIGIILASVFPLGFKSTYQWMLVVDLITTCIFIVDYILRWFTADYKYKSKLGFLKYPFGFMAIIDLISILPSLFTINSGFRLFKLFRLLRSFKVFRVFKLFRYSKSISIILNVFRKQKDTLITIAGLSFGYVLISALIILNVEPETFNTYFDALYWAMVSLTTVGYGDIYPVTIAGKIITMISAVLGIAIVALPAGVITAGLMEEIEESKKDK